MSTRCIIVNESTNYLCYAHSQFKDNILPHATVEALIESDFSQLEGSTIYLKCFPCLECAKAICFSGIKKVVYQGDSEDPASVTTVEQLFGQYGVTMVQNEKINFVKERGM